MAVLAAVQSRLAARVAEPVGGLQLHSRGPALLFARPRHSLTAHENIYGASALQTPAKYSLSAVHPVRRTVANSPPALACEAAGALPFKASPLCHSRNEGGAGNCAITSCFLGLSSAPLARPWSWLCAQPQGYSTKNASLACCELRRTLLLHLLNREPWPRRTF